MNVKEQAVQIISKLAKLPKKQIESLLETPPDSKMGDLSFPCFILSKQFKKSPGEIAFDLRNKLTVPKESIFKKVEIAGPYLNFFVDEGKFAKYILSELNKKKDRYGLSNKHKGKQVIIDMLGLNPNKAGHVGHIRNGCIGDCVARLMSAVGFKTIKQSFVNDMGVPTAMVFWAYKNLKNKLPKKTGLLKKEDQWQGRIYAMIEELVKKDAKVKAGVEEIHSILESGKNMKLVKEQRKFIEACMAGQSQTWARTNASLDLDLYESDIVRSGMVEIAVRKLQEANALYERDGAIYFELSTYPFFEGMKSPDKLLIRPDGRITYTGKDVAMQLWRFNLMPDFKYKLANKIGNHKEWATDMLNGKKLNLGFNKNTHNIMVIAAEQIYVIAVDFYALKALGYEKEFKNCYHLASGMVGFGGKAKISSREGTAGLTADEILDKAASLALKEIKKRNPNLSSSKQKQLAESIGSSAIRYNMIKVDPTKFVQFDYKTALSFEGNTGPYLQYALVRANKILSKARLTKADLTLLTEQQEFELIKKIALFPEVVEKAAESYSPHIVANYAYELSQLFSAFYEKCPVIKADKKLKEARVALVKAFAQTLKNALNLLGVEEVEMM